MQVEKNHRQSKYWWLMVTKDEYELPLYVADSLAELAAVSGNTENNIRTNIYHAEKSGHKCSYRKVPKAIGMRVEEQ